MNKEVISIIQKVEESCSMLRQHLATASVIISERERICLSRQNEVTSHYVQDNRSQIQLES